MLAATPCRAGDPFLLGDERFQVRVVPGDSGLFAKFGPRFDTSARIDSVKSDGEEFLAQEGLVDEFNQRWLPPPGYDQAPSPGNLFMKIGVGLLRRTRITPYRFWDPYPLVTSAKTEIVSRDDRSVVFEQVIPPSGDRGYRYRKSYVVSPEQHRVEITYELENLGSQEIEIDQYNHNWLALSPASPSAPWTIRTPLIPGPRSLLHCQVSPGELMFHAVPQEVVYFTFAQNENPSKSSTVVSDGRKRISITCHFSASRLSIFTQGNLLAPEIFAHFRIPPGGTASWRRDYVFQTPAPLSLRIPQWCL